MRSFFTQGKFRFIGVKHHKTGVLHHYPTSFEDLTEKIRPFRSHNTVLKFYEKDLPRLIEWSEANFEANKRQIGKN
jgi:hypothetical protein